MSIELDHLNKMKLQVKNEEGTRKIQLRFVGVRLLLIQIE